MVLLILYGNCRLNSQNAFHDRKKRKIRLGHSVYCRFQMAIQHQYDYIFEMDADFSHNPNDLPRLYKACHDEGLMLLSVHDI